jgi:hypothetical protein
VLLLSLSFLEWISFSEYSRAWRSRTNENSMGPVVGRWSHWDMYDRWLHDEETSTSTLDFTARRCLDGTSMPTWRWLERQRTPQSPCMWDCLIQTLTPTTGCSQMLLLNYEATNGDPATETLPRRSVEVLLLPWWWLVVMSCLSPACRRGVGSGETYCSCAFAVVPLPRPGLKPNRAVKQSSPGVLPHPPLVLLCLLI